MRRFFGVLLFVASCSVGLGAAAAADAMDASSVALYGQLKVPIHRRLPKFLPFLWSGLLRHFVDHPACACGGGVGFSNFFFRPPFIAGGAFQGIVFRSCVAGVVEWTVVLIGGNHRK